VTPPKRVPKANPGGPRGNHLWWPHLRETTGPTGTGNPAPGEPMGKEKPPLGPWEHGRKPRGNTLTEELGKSVKRLTPSVRNSYK